MLRFYILKHIFASAILVGACSLSVFADDRIASVNGKYTYILTENDNVTIKEAKIRSIDHAKAEALKNEFGVMVMSDFINTEKGVNEDSQSFYVLDTSSSVKGEWITDEKPPVVNIECVDGELHFTAEVWGKAREIVRSKTAIEWQVQKSVDDAKIETERFMSGERVYVKFKVPTDGYAAVYLITGDNNTYCLLPYRNDTRGRMPVRGGKTYTFFDRVSDPMAQQYKLKTDQSHEYNQLIVIYSPNPFTKCMDIKGDPKSPNSLPQKEFAKWLLKNQRDDKEMVVARKWVAIESADEIL